MFILMTTTTLTARLLAEAYLGNVKASIKTEMDMVGCLTIVIMALDIQETL